MDYVCIKCGAKWEDHHPAEGPSGGLCLDCLIAYVRGKQRFHGYEECFKTKGCFCPKKECTYFELCNKGLDPI